MKMISVTALFLAAFVSNASAQCATGVDTGGGACIPPDAAGMPGYNSNIPQPTEIPPILEDRWGAIVFGVDKRADGSVTGLSSEKDAIKAGMAKCHSQGAKNCQPQFTYHNQCAAVAWGSDDYAISSAAGELEARSRALKDCNKLTKNCEIVHTACSYPERVN